MDMREKVTELESKLKEQLKDETLTKNQKKIIATALEYGYASAFCSRTCDMNESFFAAGQYTDDYKKMLKEVNNEK